jgi:hypothetical protein
MTLAAVKRSGFAEHGQAWRALAIPAYRSYPRDVATAAASVERLRGTY